MRLSTTLIVALGLVGAAVAYTKCSLLETKYEACLRQGYESSIGCTANEVESGSKQGNSKCGTVETKLVKKCGYSCKNYDLSCAKEGYDFWGADISDSHVADFETCASTCADTAGCKSISFRYSDSNCWLKNKNGGENGPSLLEGMASMNMFCDHSELDTTCMREGQNYWGADLANYDAPSFEDCALDCREIDTCNSVTYSTTDLHCWLKTRRGGESGPSLNADLISMNKVCDDSPLDATCRQDDTNFWGADLNNLQVGSFEGCLVACLDTQECVSVTYRATDTECWLKDSEDGENGASAEAGLVSMNMDCS